ncbi:MAG: YegP family protein, partial [Actinomycetota bacterium]|nr:YegP family protein [Actinomycetota bacterium]
MPAKYVVKKGTSGRFRFSLVSANGNVLVVSEAYNTKAAALGGVRAVRRVAGDAAIEDQTTKAWADAERARREALVAKKAAATAKK